MNLKKYWATVLCLFLISIGMSIAMSSAQAADKLQVYTVNYPLQYFAERIGGDFVDVQFPAPGDIDPAFWMPDTKTIGAYQQADLILLNGAGYAKWATKVSLPRRKLVNTSSSFMDDYIRVDDKVTHQHGPGGDHSHAGTAFTTWLDFTQAAMQAEQVALAMKKARPGHARVFEENYRQLERDLMQLDTSLREIISVHPEIHVLASHPVYQYLARRYQLKLQSLMWEPDVSPDAAQWRELELVNAKHSGKWMLWEARPIAETQTGLASMGIRSIVFEPCMNRPAEGDFLAVMKANIENLGSAWQ